MTYSAIMTGTGVTLAAATLLLLIVVYFNTRTPEEGEQEGLPPCGAASPTFVVQRWEGEAAPLDTARFEVRLVQDGRLPTGLVAEAYRQGRLTLVASAGGAGSAPPLQVEVKSTLGEPVTHSVPMHTNGSTGQPWTGVYAVPVPTVEPGEVLDVTLYSDVTFTLAVDARYAYPSPS